MYYRRRTRRSHIRRMQRRRTVGSRTEASAGSGTTHVSLTEALGRTGVRPDVRYLPEGDEMGYHRRIGQGELYEVLSGPGRIRIEDGDPDVPDGSALRTPPETGRQVLNDGSGAPGEHVRLIIGAPGHRRRSAGRRGVTPAARLWSPFGCDVRTTASAIPVTSSFPPSDPVLSQRVGLRPRRLPLHPPIISLV